MVVQCCVCKMVKVEGKWVTQAPDSKRVSHTYCKTCLADTIAAIKEERRVYEQREVVVA